MNTERIMALDISTKTGWAVMVSSPEGISLEKYGTISQMSEPEGQYPHNYVEWAYACFNEIFKLIHQYNPDVLVIEETSGGSKSNYSQKILEFIHFLVALWIKSNNAKCMYLMTEQWRRETGCLMTKEESKHNKMVRQYKEKNETKIAYDTSGKRIGLLTKKHINIRRANEIFGKFLPTELRKKDEDTADALMLGYCYHVRRMRSLNGPQ